MLEGELDFQMAGHEPVAIKAAGEALFEPDSCVHLRAANPCQSSPTQLIAMVVGKQGLRIVLPPGCVDEESPGH